MQHFFALFYSLPLLESDCGAVQDHILVLAYGIPGDLLCLP